MADAATRTRISQTNVGLTTDDIEADHEYLRGRGVDVDEEVMRMGDPVPPMFFLRDQDGNTFLLVEEQAAQPGT